ncbi:MAG: SDR family oxidoreductase [Erysipelotrichaceae bacterium]|nr:SDR family oxidoreductase [Solobacterium sp.]MDY2732087.1 SDR family oxidoreductase [Erysipelotrichaceae bacterium]MDY5652139.1 SDR family oxidoreductase [Erysipelotrichaceae bacterium]
MKKILITGGSDGIGKALALMLDEKGYETYIFGRNPEKLNNLKLNHCIKKYAFDLKDRDKLNEALNDINNSGGVDILINNAGFNYKKEEVKDINISGLEDMMWVNCLSHLVCIEAVLPRMLEKGEGMIVNVLSSCCKANIATMGGYTASKKAMEALSKILVKEVKDKGVKVLDVYPGGVDTNFRRNERTDYLRPETIAKHIIYVLENNEDGMMQEIVCRPVVENNY